jgi:hypothetical protein
LHARGDATRGNLLTHLVEAAVLRHVLDGVATVKQPDLLTGGVLEADSGDGGLAGDDTGEALGVINASLGHGRCSATFLFGRDVLEEKYYTTESEIMPYVVSCHEEHVMQ